jgi:PTS system fructose-specific IIC component
MAAESLENKAKEMGITLKAETNGSGGAKNVLTKEEIENCDGIIVAADKNVEMARFDGKQVLQTKVADGINKPEELIQTILDKKAPTYHHSGAAAQEDSAEGESVGRQIYKHLMNGVSHMLPFVIGGGILIALAFLVDNQAINPANFGKNTPLAALLKTIGEQAFGFMLPILAGFIAMSIADRPGLAVGFVGGYIMVLLRKLFDKLPSALEGLKPILLFPVCGILIMGVVMIAVNPVVGAINTGLNNFLSSMSGTSSILLGAVLGAMMSIDMGGPFNKAAYVFGTAQLTVANAGPEQYAIMAAVMAGGMVPPLAIALCTTFFKNRFTESERKSGVVNYIMGLSFITEGAIPFAAGDPIHILPPCIVGSAVAGALSMAFKCGLPAPHGGIFVIGVITNRVQYLISVAVGAVIGMIVMSFTKKPLNK